MTDRPDTQYAGRHYVYRLFDKYGELIYIGMTQDVVSRVQAFHRNPWINPWAHYVDRYESDEYPDRVTARAAEKAAIAEACPPFNKNHNPRRREGLREDYEARWQERQPPPSADAVALLGELFFASRDAV